MEDRLFALLQRQEQAALTAGGESLRPRRQNQTRPRAAVWQRGGGFFRAGRGVWTAAGAVTGGAQARRGRARFQGACRRRPAG